MTTAASDPKPSREELRQRFLTQAAAAFDLMFAPEHQDQLITFEQAGRKNGHASWVATSPLGCSNNTPTPTPTPNPTRPRPVPSASGRVDASPRTVPHSPRERSPPSRGR